MKLYVFEAGKLLSQKQYFTMGVDIGVKYDIPVPFLYIDHPKGKVLFDTGNALEVVDNKEEHWGDFAIPYDPAMTKDQWCVNALKNIGVQPEDIDWVICSHLHADHAGGVGQFPKARYVVQKEELYYAYVPDSFMRSVYIRKDFDKPVDWHILNGWADDKFDLFGDGRIITYFTPGHTPGHMSLMLDLPKTGKMLFAGDACYTVENYEKNILPGLAWNFGECEKSVRLIRKLVEADGARLVTGHDPEAFKQLKVAPKYYE